jgi:thioredoxin 2
MTNKLHVVCPHCEAVNRIPGSRLGDGPNCGQCHRALFDAKPHDVRGSALRRQVARSDVPVVVDFWAEWCGPCHRMAPEFERAAAELGHAARLLKLNTEESAEIASELGIRSIPTMVLFAGGREIARQSGAMHSSDIVRWVQMHAGGASQ